MGQHVLQGNIKRADRYDTEAVAAISISLTPRQLNKLQALFTHGMLDTAMLHELLEPHVTQRNTTDDLMLMFRPPHSFIEKPSSQFDIKHGHANNLIYRITEKGVGALVDAGRITLDQAELWQKSRQNATNDIWHDVDTGYLTASIEIGCKKAGHRFIPWYEILAHPSCPQATRDADNPFKIVTKRTRLKNDKIVEHGTIPDAIFRIQRNASYSPLIFLETDKGTEQNKASEYKHSTLANKITSYRFILANELHKRHFGTKSASIYIINDKLLRRQNIMKAALDIAKEANTSVGPFFFGCITQLNRDNDEERPIGDHVYTMAYKTANGREEFLDK